MFSKNKINAQWLRTCLPKTGNQCDAGAGKAGQRTEPVGQPRTNPDMKPKYNIGWHRFLMQAVSN